MSGKEILDECYINNNKYCCYSYNDNCLDFTLSMPCYKFIFNIILDMMDNEIETNWKSDWESIGNQ